MEDTLRVMGKTILFEEEASLNPCFNGRYSQRLIKIPIQDLHLVLILVLMEDTLRGLQLKLLLVGQQVLILVLMEDTLRGVKGSSP